ncbi:MAG: S8 family serine peptidase [Salinivirgaceae bacterium]
MATNKFFLFLVLFVIFKSGFTQNYNYAFLVEFTDKSGTIYQATHLEAFLSERAIQRREKYQIVITEEDFPVNKKYCDSLLSFNAKLHNTSRWFNSAVFFTNDETFPSKVEPVSFVKKVTKIYGTTVNKSGLAQSKWDDEAQSKVPAFVDYGASQNQITMCNAQLLHNQGYLGQGIQIAVIDGGFYNVNQLQCFDSLFQNNQILGTWDFVSGNSLVYDDHTHGMMVLSIIGGNLPQQFMGSAPGASFWLLRSENTNSEFPIEEENWISAAEFADSAGVDIITSSLGYSEFDDMSMNYTYQDMDGKTTRVTQGAEKAFSKGLLVVNSAGNSRNDPWFFLTAPSDGEHVLGIGAVDSLKHLAYFSSSGPSSDGRVKPDVTAQGFETSLVYSDGSVGKGSGTSFSCPLVAGMVACLWQSLPELSNQEILNLIRQTASSTSTPDNDFGYGIPDFAKAYSTGSNSNITDYSTDQILKLFPNPFFDYLKVNAYIVEKQRIAISISDISGSILYNKTLSVENTTMNYFQIDGLSKLQAGVYLLTITSKDKQTTQLILKNK